MKNIPCIQNQAMSVKAAPFKSARSAEKLTTSQMDGKDVVECKQRVPLEYYHQ